MYIDSNNSIRNTYVLVRRSHLARRAKLNRQDSLIIMLLLYRTYYVQLNYQLSRRYKCTICHVAIIAITIAITDDATKARERRAGFRIQSLNDEMTRLKDRYEARGRKNVKVLEGLRHAQYSIIAGLSIAY